MISFKNTITILALSFLAISLIGILSFSLIESRQQIRSLNKQLEYLEGNIESAKQNNLEKLETLEKELDHHTRQNQNLKLQLQSSQGQKEILNKKSDENKAAIHRIHAIDSLYRTIARHNR